MRITFLLPNDGHQGGVRVVASYAHSLSDRGHEVTIVYCAHKPDGRAAILRSKAPWLAKRPSSPAKSYFDDAKISRIEVSAPSDINDSIVPDAEVICSTWWETANWACKLSPSKGVFVSLVQHDESLLGMPRAAVYATWKLPKRIIAISRWIGDIVRSEVPDKCIVIVPNSVDQSQFNSDARTRSNSNRIGALYSPMFSKGWDVVKKVYKSVKAEMPAAEFIAFGNYSPSLLCRVPSWIEYYRSPDPNSLAGLYRSMDVFLCCSRSEGFGLPALEASACGTPVVSTAVGGVHEFVVDGESGYICNVGDIGALATRCLGVLRLSGERWSAMSDRARYQTSGYTWIDATDLLEKEFREACETAHTLS